MAHAAALGSVVGFFLGRTGFADNWDTYGVTLFARLDAFAQFGAVEICAAFFELLCLMMVGRTIQNGPGDGSETSAPEDVADGEEIFMADLIVGYRLRAS